MSRSSYALLAVAFLAMGSATPAAAVTVDYQLTFSGPSNTNVGTGTLELNLPSFSDSTQINYTNLPSSIFSSLSATIGGIAFDLTSNDVTGFIQGNNPNALNFALFESPSTNGTNGPILGLSDFAGNTGTFEIEWSAPSMSGQQSAWNLFPLLEGTFTVGEAVDPPSQVAGVPEVSTWAMLIIGFAITGGIGYRRSRKSTATAA